VHGSSLPDSCGDLQYAIAVRVSDVCGDHSNSLNPASVAAPNYLQHAGFLVDAWQQRDETPSAGAGDGFMRGK
jgi:hypothetical protein